jgi:putative thiamine transport system substrate-binding protein
MVVADFLLDPATQAHAQDYRQIGNFTVLDMSKLTAAERQRFDDLPKSPALPTNAELGITLLEPHPSWMARITSEWEKRFTK